MWKNSLKGDHFRILEIWSEQSVRLGKSGWGFSYFFKVTLGSRHFLVSFSIWLKAYEMKGLGYISYLSQDYLYKIVFLIND